jgi:isoleucyl-tRNA synthetase
MSKSKGNSIPPSEVVKKHSRDVLRYYLLYSPAWNDYYFNWKDVDAIAKSFVIMENTFTFIQNYVPRVSDRLPDLKPEDRWLLSRLNSLVKNSTENMENYNAHKALEDVSSFIIGDLSRTYIKLVRDRVWPAYGGDEAAFYTLYTAAKTVSRLLAPFTPFFAEDIYQRVVLPLGETTESVHLCEWPRIDEKFISTELESDMALALKIIESANSLRAKSKIKLRQPLRALVIGGDGAKRAVATYSEVIAQMTNVKDVQFGYSNWQHEQPEFKLWLDTELDDALKHEGAIRELIRHIQEQRKAAKLVVADRISLSVVGLDVGGFEGTIKTEVGATEIITDKKGKLSKFEIDGQAVEVGISVVTTEKSRKKK